MAGGGRKSCSVFLSSWSDFHCGVVSSSLKTVHRLGRGSAFILPHQKGQSIRCAFLLYFLIWGHPVNLTVVTATERSVRNTGTSSDTTTAIVIVIVQCTVQCRDRESPMGGESHGERVDMPNMWLQHEMALEEWFKKMLIKKRVILWKVLDNEQKKLPLWFLTVFWFFGSVGWFFLCFFKRSGCA